MIPAGISRRPSGEIRAATGDWHLHSIWQHPCKQLTTPGADGSLNPRILYTREELDSASVAAMRDIFP